jgi:hypothetical protein
MHVDRDDEDHFILIDFDLAVCLDENGRPLARERSRHRTGTLPFMAHELVHDMYLAEKKRVTPREDVIVHCVRHDFESVLWVSFWCAISIEKVGTCDTQDYRQKRMKYLAEWESGTYKQMAYLKYNMLTYEREMQTAPLSPSFQHLKGWLLAFHKTFSEGFFHNRIQAKKYPRCNSDKESFKTFETWHGAVTREKLEKAMRDRDGESDGESDSDESDQSDQSDDDDSSVE